MSCLPGMPCYNSPVVKIVYPPGCDPTPVPVISSDQVHYDGPNLPCTGVQDGDCLNTVLEKIDTKICSEELVASIIQTIANNEVLKAYFCQLVSECGPTTTTTTSSTSTTTTTTTAAVCPAPTITNISTNGAYPQATVTIDYNVNGIVDVLSLTLWYSLDPNFEGTVFTDVISNLNLTSYSFPMTGTSTWYFKLRKVCGTDPEFPTGESYSNVVSIAPQPTTTTSTTTSCTAGLTEITFANGILNTETSEFIVFGTGTVEDACNALATYLAGGGVWVWGSFPAFVSSFEVGATTVYPGWCTAVPDGTYINPDASNVVFIVSGGLISSIIDCSSTTTTTTTTIACATPTLNSATSDGFGNVTLDYNLNGSTLCTFVLAEYSDYPSFSPLSFSETIPDGCNQTSYILTLNTSSTQYVRVSMICDGNTLNSNIISVVPGTTTTTTTIP